MLKLQTESRTYRYLTYTVLAYLVLMPFVRIGLLPVVAAKVQPTEAVFLVMFPLAVAFFGKRLIPRSKWLLGAFIAYLVTNIIAAMISGALGSGLEAIGRVYLVLLILVVARYVADRERSEISDLLDWYLYGTAVLALFAYLGYLAGILGYSGSMVQVYGNYPYLGTVMRAKGFTGGAGMLIIVLILPVLYAYSSWRNGQKHAGWFWFLLPLAFLTFSKELLLILFGLCLVDPWIRRMPRWLPATATFGVAVVFWLGTHYIVQPRQEVADSYLAGTQYTSEKVVWAGGNWQVLETSYTALKKAGVRVAKKHPVFGVGPGQFGNALPEEIAEGNYPAHLPLYDPHSTWLGALSETGLPGFLALTFMCLIVLGQIRSLLPTEDVATLAIFVSLLMILILSVSKDVANFRFIWVMLGLLLGLTWRQKQVV